MILLSLLSWKKLKKNWEKEKPDFVMAYLMGYLPLLVRMRSKYKPKIINSIQGKPRWNGFRCWLWKRFYLQSDCLIVLSEQTKKDIVTYVGYPEEMIEMVKNPIIDNKVLHMADEELESTYTNIQVPIIIGVGRLTRQKDFTTLIDAFYIVSQKTPCHLWILGDGEQRNDLQNQIVKLHLQGKVQLLGFVKNPYKYMKKAEVFVLSSLWEDAGHVLVEAAYLKLKLVSTRCPHGQEEFLDYGKRGELCDMQNPEDMADAIQKMLDKNNESENIEKTELAKKAAAEFDLEHHGEQLERLIKKICG